MGNKLRITLEFEGDPDLIWPDAWYESALRSGWEREVKEIGPGYIGGKMTDFSEFEHSLEGGRFVGSYPQADEPKPDPEPLSVLEAMSSITAILANYDGMLNPVHEYILKNAQVTLEKMYEGGLR
jgi:hypothetical protein